MPLTRLVAVRNSLTLPKRQLGATKGPAAEAAGPWRATCGATAGPARALRGVEVPVTGLPGMVRADEEC